MTSRTIKLPDIGEGVAQAEVAEWHVNVGDDVIEDQILAAVMTDKATVEIPAPFAGRVTKLGGVVGEILPVGGPLVELEVGSDKSADTARLSAASHEREGPRVESGARPTSIAELPVSHSSAPRLPQEVKPTALDRPLASPAVRRRASEAGIDLRKIPGTGPANRISNEDLDRFSKGDQTPARKSGEEPDRTETNQLVGLRRKIAERMAEATRRVAHFSYIEEVDVTSVEELRARLNERYAKERAKLTLLSFVVRAIVLAVHEYPQMNSLYDDDAQAVTRHSAVHVGIATQTDAGLLVPVLTNVHRANLWECATEIRRLADAARSGASKRHELAGSTITITSLGELGGFATTPVINRPEVAIVGVNRISVRPVWINNQFSPRKMMNLSCSFDHRIVDGQEAARFVQAIKGYIELPATLFIE